jgi:hypothetical protein
MLLILLNLYILVHMKSSNWKDIQVGRLVYQSQVLFIQWCVIVDKYLHYRPTSRYTGYFEIACMQQYFDIELLPASTHPINLRRQKFNIAACRLFRNTLYIMIYIYIYRVFMALSTMYIYHYRQLLVKMVLHILLFKICVKLK